MSVFAGRAFIKMRSLANNKALESLILHAYCFIAIYESRATEHDAV